MLMVAAVVASATMAAAMEGVTTAAVGSATPIKTAITIITNAMATTVSIAVTVLTAGMACHTSLTAMVAGVDGCIAML